MAEVNPYESPKELEVDDVDQMADDGTATIIPLSRRYYGMGLLFGVFGCVFFALLFFAFAPDWDASGAAIAAVVVGLLAFFFVWFSVCSVYFLNPGAYGVVIDAAGVHERYIFGQKSFPWSNILSIEMADVDGGSMVAFSLKQRPRWVWGFGRYDYYLANQYQMSKEEMFALLRARQAQFTK